MKVEKWSTPALGLVHRIGAALQGVASHAEVTAAMASVLGQRDRGRSIDALASTLVQLLDENDDLTDDLVLAAAHEGEVAFVGHVLARRAAIPADSAITELLSADSARMMALFRAAELSRTLSAGLLAGVGDLLGIADPADAISAFDMMTDEQVREARTWLATPADYRAGLAALGERHGKRPV